MATLFVDDDAAAGGDGSSGSPYQTIQAALNAADAGDVLRVRAGTYAETLTINEGVTLKGANAGLDGTSGARGAETIITGPVTVTATTGVTLDGFQFRYTGSGDYTAVSLSTAAGHAVSNSVFYTEQPNGDADARGVFISGGASGAVTIDDNYFTGAFQGSGKYGSNTGNEASWRRGIWSDGGGVDTTITGNSFEHVRSGMNLDGLKTDATLVDDNDFISCGTGIAISTTDPVLNLTSLSGNVFTGVDDDINLRNVDKPVTFDLGSNTGGGSGSDAVLHVLGGFDADTLDGTSGSDWLEGEQLLDGDSDDNDVLSGHGGDDLLQGVDGDDTLDGGAGNDTLQGGSGNDTATYTDGRAGYDVDVTTNGAGFATAFTGVEETGVVGVDEGADTLAGVEVVSFGDSALDLADPVQLFDADGQLVGTFDTIQDAVDAVGAADMTILVSAGTYTEQVVVDGDCDGLTIRGIGAVTIESPASMAVTGMSESYGDPVRAVVTVIDASGVTIDGVTVDGAFAGDSTSGSNGDEISGIAYLKASGTITGVTVENVSNSPGGGLFGLQHGSGIFVDNGAGPQQSITITDSTVTDFQKSGILVVNADVDISGNTVTGIGATNLTAQNMLQVSGSEGTIDDNDLSGFGYTPANYYSSGIIAFEPSGDLAFTDNDITGAGADGGSAAGLDLSDVASGVTVTVTGNDIDSVDYGLVAYTYDDTIGLDSDPATGGNNFTNIGVQGVYLDPEAGSFTTTTAFTESGSGFADFLAGSDGGDNLSGLGGADELIGRGGDDTLNGGGGNDLLTPGAGDATIAGGAGFDVLTLAGEIGDWTIERVGGVLTATDGTDTVTLSGIEVIDFTGGADLRFVGGDSEVASIQAAVDASGTGDTIYVRDGDYTEGHTATGSEVGAGTSYGLYVDVEDLSIIGVDDDEHAITDSNDVVATVTAANQSNFGANHFVVADGVTVQGLGFLPAVGVTVNKTFEVWGDAFTLRNSVIDAGGAGALYFNDPTIPPGSYVPGVTESVIQHYLVDGNEILGAVIVANGVGLGGDAADMVISDNVIGPVDPSQLPGRAGLILQGNVPSTGFLNAPVVAPTVTGNTFDEGSPRAFYSRDINESGRPDADYFQDLVEDNDVGDYAFAVTPGGQVRASDRPEQPAGSAQFAMLQRTVAAIDYAQAGDTIRVEAGPGAVADTVTSDGVLIQATAATTDLDLTLAAGIVSVTLLDHAPGAGADVDVTGNAAANTITGNSGDNRLLGLAGNDVLTGGAGDDLLNGGSNGDTASYAGATAGVTVSLALTGAQATGGAGSDTLVSIERLTGSAFADTLTGSNGANTLRGGGGSDVLTGGVGDDALYGDSGQDTASYAGATSAVTVDLAIATAQATGGAGTDTLTAIERVVGSAFADLLYGNGVGNRLTGGEGNDSLDGRDGADFLFGGRGTDTLLGGNGADYLQGDAGNDTLTGGTGADTFFFFAAAGRDRVNDFTHGSDLLSFSGFGSSYDTKAEIVAAGQQVGANFEITLDNPGTGTGDTVIRLIGIASITTADIGTVVA